MTLTDNQKETAAAQTRIPATVFRAYDIRGIANAELSIENVETISRAIGSEALDLGIDTLLVGYDGRLSSPDLSRALIAGILATGCNVVDLGMVPTPLLYFAAHTSAHTSGVMVTASHNPADYNGLKIVFNRSCLADNQIQSIRRRIDDRELREGEGSYSALDICDTYLEYVCSKIALQRKLRLVIDCGNAVPGVIAPRLFEKLGCEVIPLYCDIDGNFPNHHPDPTIPENLHALAATVTAHQADLGIGFDGDGDRLGMVSDRGDFIDADRMLMLLAKDIVPRYPGEPIIFDVKCGTGLAALIADLGGIPLMHRSGHSFMKQKMQETQAPLGGEFSAHVFIKDRWFGYDDGLYAAARLVELLSQRGHSASAEFADYSDTVSTPELKLPVADANKSGLIDRILELAEFPDATVITIDGLRVEFDDGWGLVRASNTTPAILLRFEASTEEKLAEIKNRFKALIHAADTKLDLESLPGFDW